MPTPLLYALDSSVALLILLFFFLLNPNVKMMMMMMVVVVMTMGMIRTLAITISSIRTFNIM